MARIVWFLLALGVLALDQVTKYLVVESLSLHQAIPITSFFTVTLTYNTGAAFSFLSDAGGWQRWLFTAIAIALSAVMIVWLTRLKAGEVWLGAALALILGGALGNLWDRLVLGKVVDFLLFYYDRWAWPAFNVADTSICIGAACLLIATFKGEGSAQKK